MPKNAISRLPVTAQKCAQKCFAENIFAKIFLFFAQIDRTIQLTLEEAPDFTVRPENLIADAGESVTLNCQAIGEPTPEISKWEALYREAFYPALNQWLHIHSCNSKRPVLFAETLRLLSVP